MNQSSSHRARQIFAQLSELPTAEQDAALLTLCGDDPDLMDQIQRLRNARRSDRGLGDSAAMTLDPGPDHRELDNRAAVTADPGQHDRELDNRAAVTADPVHAPDPFGLEASRLAEAPVEQFGTQIGPYRLLQLIGQGGFGSVFLAEQTKPVARSVALKIIKLGMDTRAVVARFEQERQALAMMDHPNVAKVFDAGATSTGRPYFVMELCKGEPITDYCDRVNLSVPDRLALFVLVCHAVQHAHSKGLIHRDIKPSNILVVEEDGRPVPKVIDFGIAKATAAKLTEMTVHTEHHQMIGTPQYMSPEQAEGSLDIDTRTDVYALGVLLYELLTGETPFDAKSLRTATYADIPRLIREVDPAKPSVRLRQNPSTIARLAAQRHTEPRKLGLMLRGELDWIVMKAVEKDRQRRYSTANALAMDVERYLKGEAVVAAPPSRSYRISKFIKRHKGPVAAAAILALALVGGLIGTTYGLRQAVLARDGEEAAKENAQREAERALTAEVLATARANELKLVSEFQADMLAQIDPNIAGQDLTEDVTGRFAAALAKAGVPASDQSGRLEAFREEWSKVNATDAARELIDRTILKPAIAAIDEKFKDQPLVDAQLRQTLAVQYLELGLYDQAHPLITTALATRRRELGEDQPETLESLNAMGILLQRQGKLAEAEQCYRQALEKRRLVLGNAHPETLQSIGWLGYLLDEQRRFEEAEPLLRETLETSRKVLGEEHPTTLDGIAAMGSRLAKQGKLEEAEPYCREALEKRRRVLGEEHRDTIVSLSHLGDLLLAERKPADAEPFFREGREKSRRVLGEEHPYTLSLTNGLGKALQEQGNYPQAEAHIRDALEKRRRVLGEEHPETLVSVNNMGAVLRDQGKLGDAEPFFVEALEKSRVVMGEETPETLTAINNLGILLRNQGKLTEAEPYYLQSLDTSRRVFGDEHPETLKAMNNMAALLWSQQKYADAKPFAREAMEKRRRVLGEEHQDTLISISNFAGLLRDQGELSAAAKYYGEALEGARRVLGEDHPYTLIFSTSLGGVLVAQEEWTDAEALLAAVEARVRKAFPGGNAHRLAALLTSLGTARAALAEDPAALAAAEANLLEAWEIYGQVPGPSPTGPQMALEALVDFYASRNEVDPGKGYDIKASEWRTKLDGRTPSTRPSS